MQIELKEIRDFLASHAPFNRLAADLQDNLPRQIIIRYLRRGSDFPPTDLTSPHLLLLRTGAVELRDAGDNLMDKLAEGDSYVEACRNSSPAVKWHGTTVEDSLVYLIPCTTVQQLCSNSPAFKEYFSESLRERMQQAVTSTQSQLAGDVAMNLPVHELTYRPPVMVEYTGSIQQIAKTMTQEKVSSVLVMQANKLVGLVTDRDLRERCLAGDISRQQPISEIMTTPVITIEDHALLSEALLLMTRHRLHHLPVLSGENPIGNLTASDIIRHLSTNAAFIATDIGKANSIDALVKISLRLPELQLQLANSNTTARQIGEVISSVTDLITQRLLQLAEAEFGPPPVGYVWVASGSQARGEQTSHSDQDNALIIDDAVQPAHADYFTQLTQYVCDGLNSCGYVYCPGNAMASNPQWRQPLHSWLNYFTTWIERPERMALMLSSIFFDLRPIYGETTLFDRLQQAVLAKTQANRIFIAHMVANALTHQPPLGFFRNFVLVHDGEHNHTLDIKHRGLVCIVDLARIYALENGIGAANSTDRLKAAIVAGALSHEMGENLIDALEFIASLRIQHQAMQIRRGDKADNFLPPTELSGLERQHLKNAFAIINTMQEVLDNRHQASRLT